MLSRGQSLGGCGARPWEGKEVGHHRGNDGPGLQREEPDAAEEEVEIAIDTLRKGQLRQERIDRLAESLGDPAKRADVGGVGSALVLAEQIRPEKGSSGQFPLRHLKESADLTDAAPDGVVEGLGRARGISP